jgi:hypothetical protein
MAAAQENSLPKVLEITGEYTKPGKAHALHDKTEGAFVQAKRQAKSPDHWLGLISLSGRKRALFFTWHASFEAWERSDEAQQKNAALVATLSRDYIADGEMVDSEDQGIFVYRDELSLRPMADLSQMRYLDIATYHVRPGHDSEFTELMKMVRAAYEKGVPDARWTMYQQLYGGDDGSYLILTPRKSLAELDRILADNNPKFAAAMGEDRTKRLNELVSASLESSQHQLFAVNPRTSYVPDEWIKADVFWKP